MRQITEDPLSQLPCTRNVLAVRKLQKQKERFFEQDLVWRNKSWERRGERCNELIMSLPLCLPQGTSTGSGRAYNTTGAVRMVQRPRFLRFTVCRVSFVRVVQSLQATISRYTSEVIFCSVCMPRLFVVVNAQLSPALTRSTY